MLAARLSEHPDTPVLLVEAGPMDGPAAMAVPDAWPTLLGTSLDRSSLTVPQPGQDGLRQLYSRGKVLGGSSSINGTAFLRGHRDGYDAWVRGERRAGGMTICSRISGDPNGHPAAIPDIVARTGRCWWRRARSTT